MAHSCSRYLLNVTFVKCKIIVGEADLQESSYFFVRSGRVWVSGECTFDQAEAHGPVLC